jgi:hypothetical protein
MHILNYLTTFVQIAFKPLSALSGKVLRPELPFVGPVNFPRGILEVTGAGSFLDPTLQCTLFRSQAQIGFDRWSLFTCCVGYRGTACELIVLHPNINDQVHLPSAWVCIRGCTLCFTFNDNCEEPTWQPGRTTPNHHIPTVVEPSYLDLAERQFLRTLLFCSENRGAGH